MTDPDELIDGLLRDFPHHRPGTRPVHSFGVVATGEYQPNDVAHRFVTATPLAGPASTPVTVRYSSGRGDRHVPDSKRDVRGMAVRFERGGQPPFDLICMTLPIFFNRTVANFQKLMTAAEPPAEEYRRGWLRKLLDQIHLRTAPEDLLSSDVAVGGLSADMPEICPALVSHLHAGATESFATRRYHAVHAYRVTGDDGATRWLRFTWDPVAGVRNIKTDAERFLEGELGTRDCVQFVLRALVADQGDDLGDPTRPWPRSRQRLVLGHLTLDGFTHGSGEELEFNPHHLPDGITVDKSDEIFWTRGDVYKRSAERRKAVRHALTADSGTGGQG